MTENWKVAAEGVSLAELEQIMANQKLPKGTRVRVVMETSAEYLFDFIAAEWAFQQVMPDDLKIIDVWGDRGQGIVEAEVTGTWLVAILAFIRAHWVAVTIAGFLIWLFISFIMVLIKVPSWAAFPLGVVAGIGLAAVGLVMLGSKQKYRQLVPT